MQRTHYEHHRVSRTVVFLVVIVLDGSALNGVAGIDQHRVGILFARARDERGNFRETAVVWFVCVVIKWIDIAVKVGRTQNGNLNPLLVSLLATDREDEADERQQQGGRNEE